MTTPQVATPIDETYHEARPPRMTDGDDFPNRESLRREYGRSELGLDDVIDRDYPWQTMAHDSPAGKQRMEDVKREKAQNVKNYVLTRSKFWRWFKKPDYFPNEKKTIYTYKVGRSRAQKTTVEAGIELSLGLPMDGFTIGLKSDLKWSSEIQESFEESREETSEETFEGDCWYLFWQTVEELTLFRQLRGTDVLDEVSNIQAPTNLTMVDKNRIRKPSAEIPMLRATQTKLEIGQGCNWAGYPFGNTKVSMKAEGNDDGELTVTWAGLGKQIVAVPHDKVTVYESWRPVAFRTTNSGVAPMQVWTDV